jgi:hypothetical protein
MMNSMTSPENSNEIYRHMKTSLHKSGSVYHRRPARAQESKFFGEQGLFEKPQFGGDMLALASQATDCCANVSLSHSLIGRALML